MDDLVAKYETMCNLRGNKCVGCRFEKISFCALHYGYEQGRADMLTEIKAKARKYHRGKSEPVQFVIYDNELEELKEQTNV